MIILYHNAIFLCFRFIKKSQSIDESINSEAIEDVSSESEDDERSDSFELDGKEKLREKRKGLDLATTLERIEKNFVITDPRLPDNPIVRFFKSLILDWKCFPILCWIPVLEVKMY